MESTRSTTLKLYNLSTHDVAVAYGVTQLAVRAWIRKGIVKAIRVGGDGEWRMNREDVEAAHVRN